MSCDGNVWLEQDQPLSSPYMVASLLKRLNCKEEKQACNFSGICRRACLFQRKILRMKTCFWKLRKKRVLILKNSKDLHSQSAVKALQCDMKIAAEMDVSVNPTLTFFNTQHEDEGLKVPATIHMMYMKKSYLRCWATSRSRRKHRLWNVLLNISASLPRRKLLLYTT